MRMIKPLERIHYMDMVDNNQKKKITDKRMLKNKQKLNFNRCSHFVRSVRAHLEEKTLQSSQNSENFHYGLTFFKNFLLADILMRILPILKVYEIFFVCSVHYY